MKTLKNYTGSKNGAGVFHKIISAMPKHKVFIELFAGSMAITRRKKPALKTIGIEVNQSVCVELRKDAILPEIPNTEFRNDDALNYLLSAHFRGLDVFGADNILIYADPPYLQETRRSVKPLYDHEFNTPEQHAALIERLRALDCNVMLSGYRSKLYDDLLPDWRRIDISTSTRGGAAIESVWLNFPEPLRLHDTRFVGKNRVRRQNLKRKVASWINKLKNMPADERQLIFEALDEFQSNYGKDSKTK